MARKTDINSLEQSLASSDDRARWKAAVQLGELVETEPETIWPIVIKHGSSLDEDLRSAVATFLLEHILEHHFEIFFPKLEVEIRGGNFNLRDTFQICWKFDLAEQQVTRWENLLKETDNEWAAKTKKQG